MADWNLPTLPDPYPDFQDRLKARDTDALTMGATAITNIPVNAIIYNRSTNTFQQWNGSSWVNLILAAAGGGTGSAAGFPTLGTMATQNANNVSISGGNVSGLSSLASNGTITAGGQITSPFIVSSGAISAGAHIYTAGASGHIYCRGILITGNVDRQLTTADGRIGNMTSAYFATLQGHEITNLNGSAIDRGSIWVGFIGSGATGAGTKVLLDNGVWTDKNTIGGGVIEVVHNDVSFGSGETEKTVTIPWVGPQPASAKNVVLHILDNAISWQAKVLSGNQFRLSKPAAIFTINYTAMHYRTEV